VIVTNIAIHESSNLVDYKIIFTNSVSTNQSSFEDVLKHSVFSSQLVHNSYVVMLVSRDMKSPRRKLNSSAVKSLIVEYNARNHDCQQSLIPSTL
jgi:phage head maturation protease